MMTNRFLKRNDLILLVVALMSAAALFFFTQNGRARAGHADIYCSNESIHTLELNHAETWTWRDGDAFVSIEGSTSGVRVTQSSCADQICVRQGQITLDGQSIVCLPNKVVIHLEAANSDPMDAMLY